MSDRRIAAVMATDMVGFTAMMGADQDSALQLLARSHETLKAIVSSHDGEWLEDAGDRSITAFPSAINAVECALQIQAKLANEPQLKFRIGIDVGDIVISDGHVYGDAVNIVSFIERLADPDGLVITEAVYESIQPHIDLNVIDLGDKLLKNIGHPVRLYAISGSSTGSKVGNRFSELVARRVPHITGAYLATGWALVEVIDWVAERGAIDVRWTYAIFIGLLALTPSVLLVSYLHGAHGPDHVQKVEKFVVPLNLLLAVLLVAVTFQSVEVPDRVDPVEPLSVAVLPFVNMSDDQDNDYFSRGLSEELINSLAKVPGLYVASRTSSFSFESKSDDPRSIARKLRVASILEGSVRKQGNRVRITAQLIDGENNYHLWTETYDRELDDIFEIQENIAKAVTRELVGVLQPSVLSIFSEARAATLGAYDYYHRGLSYLRAPPTERSLESAQSLFERAIEEDHNYAQAYAGLCETALAQYELLKSPGLVDVAESECLRALSLSRNMREVRYALGVLYRYTGDFEESARIFRELLDDHPTADVWVGLGETNVAQGNIDAGEVAFKTAIEREPGNWHNRMAYAEFLYWRGRYDESLEVLRRVTELSPDNARAWLLIGATQDYLGNKEASLDATLKSIELSPSRGAYRDLGLTYYQMADYRKAADAFEKAIELGPDDHWSWGNLAEAYEILGEDDASQAAYSKAIELATASLARNERDWVSNARLAMYIVTSGGEEDEGLKRIGVSVAEGAEIDEVHFYNAVIRSRLGQNQQALDALERAVELGYPVKLIANDPRFVNLKAQQRFIDLVDK